MVITDIHQLLNELRTPRVIGVRHDDGTVERVSGETIKRAPLIDVIQELHKGNLLTCHN